MQSQLNVAVRQKTFVAQLNTRTGFSSMPFSLERTKEIQSRIDARLRSGQAGGEGGRAASLRAAA
ncbi:MAG: hypothetical protein ABJ050_05545 [Paracoccaceae bacterium]